MQKTYIYNPAPKLVLNSSRYPEGHQKDIGVRGECHVLNVTYEPYLTLFMTCFPASLNCFSALTLNLIYKESCHVPSRAPPNAIIPLLPLRIIPVSLLPLTLGVLPFLCLRNALRCLLVGSTLCAKETKPRRSG